MIFTRLTSYLLLILLLWEVSSKKQHNVSPETKLQQITELTARAKGNVITLDDSTYNYYANSKPRPYSLIVLLTATHPKFKCGICKQIDQEMALVAEAYDRLTNENKEEKKVFFLRLDYEYSQKVFQNYQVNSVPLLFHIAPHLGADKVGQEYEISSRDRFQISAVVEAEAIASFMSDHTGVSVSIKRSMIFAYIMLLVLFAIVLLAVKPIIDTLPFWLGLIQTKNLWLAVSYGVYTCAISGLIFDIIRSPQMYYANPQTGQIMFFFPQSGNQFVAEGFIIGFLNLACAGSLLFAAVFAPNFKDEQNRTIGMVAGSLAFLFCFRMIRSLYIMKNPWYGKQF